MFTLRKLEHTVSVRLSGIDLERYKRLLVRHGGPNFRDSARFRFMLRKLDVAARLEDKAVVPHVETEDERLDREDKERCDREDRERWAHADEESF